MGCVVGLLGLHVGQVMLMLKYGGCVWLLSLIQMMVDVHVG